MESSNHNGEQFEEEDLFIVKHLEIEPEISAIADPVHFKLAFNLRKPLSKAIMWKVNYIIDYTGKRVINELFVGE